MRDPTVPPMTVMIWDECWGDST